MLIECLIKREGPTRIDLKGVRLTFTPVPGSPKGMMTTSVCDVTDEAHIKYFLSRKQFREYDPERAYVEIQQALKQVRNPLEGFILQKYQGAQEPGYIVIDMRERGKPKYAGLDGLWVTAKAGIIPFHTELQAYEWLKEEMEVQEAVAEEPERQPEQKTAGYTCQECGEVCPDPIALAEHWLKNHKSPEPDAKDDSGTGEGKAGAAKKSKSK